MNICRDCVYHKCYKLKNGNKKHICTKNENVFVVGELQTEPIWNNCGSHRTKTINEVLGIYAEEEKEIR